MPAPGSTGWAINQPADVNGSYWLVSMFASFIKVPTCNSTARFVLHQFPFASYSFPPAGSSLQWALFTWHPHPTVSTAWSGQRRKCTVEFCFFFFHNQRWQGWRNSTSLELHNQITQHKNHKTHLLLAFGSMKSSKWNKIIDVGPLSSNSSKTETIPTP